MRLLNSLTRSASLRRLISPRKNSRSSDDFPLLKTVEESNVVHFDPSEETFSPPNRTSSETCSEDTVSTASNGKEHTPIVESLCEVTRPDLRPETTLASEKTLSYPSPNKSISNEPSSNSTSEEKLVVSVVPSEESGTHSPRRKLSRHPPRKTASLSRSSAAADTTEKSNPSQTKSQEGTSSSYQEESVLAVEALPKPTARSLRRQPSRRFSPRKTTARPKRSSGKVTTGKKSLSSSPSDEEMSTGKQKSSNPSVEVSAKPATCSTARDTDDCSSPLKTTPRPTAPPLAEIVACENESTLMFGKENTSAHHSGLKPSTEANTAPKGRSRVSKTSVSSFQSRTAPRQESSSANDIDAKKATLTFSLNKALTKDKAANAFDQEAPSLKLLYEKEQAYTPRKIATRRVISSFEDTKTSHTTPSPVKKTPIRGLQRWNSTTSFLQSPSEPSEVLSSRQPTPFHTPATAKYSSKHKNGISLGDMLNNYDRITSSVHSQSSTTVPEGDEESCDDDSAFASFANEEDDKPMPKQEQVRPQTSPIKCKSTPKAANKQEPAQLQMWPTKFMEPIPISMNTQEQVQPQMTLTKLMESTPKSTNAVPSAESPQKSVQTLLPKLPFDSPPKKPQASRGAPPAAIGRPRLHRRASSTALLKGSRTKSSTKPAKARRPGLHRQGSLMADNLQDFFSQYDNIYEKIVEDDSLAGW